MRSYLLLIAGILAGLCILGIILVLVTHHPSKGNSASLPQQPSNTAYTEPTATGPTPDCKEFPLAIGCATAGEKVNICTKQYPNYPPLSDILTTPANPNLGVYEGTINNLNIAGAENEAIESITVTSSRSSKSFAFNRGSVNGYVYDIHHSLVKYYYTLHTGMKAVVSFPCSQELGIFNLNQFQIVQ